MASLIVTKPEIEILSATAIVFSGDWSKAFVDIIRSPQFVFLPTGRGCKFVYRAHNSLTRIVTAEDWRHKNILSLKTGGSLVEYQEGLNITDLEVNPLYSHFQVYKKNTDDELFNSSIPNALMQRLLEATGRKIIKP